jgi:hypothetical protein
MNKVGANALMDRKCLEVSASTSASTRQVVTKQVRVAVLMGKKKRSFELSLRQRPFVFNLVTKTKAWFQIQPEAVFVIPKRAKLSRASV